MTKEEADFIKYRPEVTDVTVCEAAQSWGEGGEILSLDGKRTAINAFILLLSTDAEVHGPFVMNVVCARELCARLISEGFGPRSA